jgi:DNA-binding MarR family transcriptional regulator
MNQLAIDLNPDVTKAYGSCREYIGTLVHRQKKSQKEIAADMDYSPSDLSRKLAQSPNDSRRFTLDDLENFIEVTGELEPIIYLVTKFMAKAELSEIEKLRRELAQLKGEAA